MKYITKFLQYTDIPDEIFSHVRKIVLLNNEKLFIYNFNEIAEISPKKIIVDSVQVLGSNLLINKLQKHHLIINGDIDSISFIKDDRNEDD